MKTISLSLALRRLKDLKHQMAENDDRLSNSTVWNKGEEPSWKYTELVDRQGKLVIQLVQLKAAIAEANATTRFVFQGQEMSLAMAVATLAEFKSAIAKTKILPTLREAEITETSTSWEPDEHDYSKRVKVTTTSTQYCALTTRQRAEKVENLEKLFAELNEFVEDMNHKTTIRLPASE